MSDSSKTNGEAPRIEHAGPLTIAGLNARYTHTTRVNIPSQWDRFGPHIGTVPGQVDGVAYGVCWNYDPSGSFDYLTGVEVADVSRLPEDFGHVSLPAQRYAIFTHRGHVSALPGTIQDVWTKWLPASGHHPAESPCFERYDQRFDPKTGKGEVEIWVAIRA